MNKKMLIHPSTLVSLSYLGIFNKGKLPHNPIEFIESITNLRLIVKSNWNNIPNRTKDYVVNIVYKYLDLPINLPIHKRLYLFLKGELDTYKLCLYTIDIFIDEVLNQLELNNPEFNRLKKDILNDAIQNLNSNNVTTLSNKEDIRAYLHLLKED
jgi:hypothetical protein